MVSCFRVFVLSWQIVFNAEPFMTVESWLQAAVADADKRGLPELKSMLETLAKATHALRAADFNQSPDAGYQSTVISPQSTVDSRQS